MRTVHKPKKGTTTVLVLCVGALLPSIALAQKAPEVGYVFPPVVAAGQTTDVTFGGFDWTEDSEIHVDDPRVSVSRQGELGPFLIPRPPYWFGPKGRSTAMPIPREINHRLQVPQEVPVGPQYWQISNANGASPTSVFWVSHDRQIVEQRGRDEVIDIGTLPVGVSGRLEVIAEEDRYYFESDRDGIVTISWKARQLGADFNGCLVVTNEDGGVLADLADTAGDDGSVTIAVKKGFGYSAKFFDVDFRGNQAYVYYLDFSYRGHAEVVAPISGKTASKDAESQDAESQNVTYLVVGRGLDGTTNRVDLELSGEQLSELVTTAPILNRPAAKAWTEAATLLPDEAVFRTLRLSSDRNEVGLFQAAKGDAFVVEALCRRLGSNADIEVAIEDADGKVVASQDDGLRTSDASISFVAKVDGAYRVVVNELSGNTGATSVCLVIARKSKPHFRLTTTQVTAIPVGGKTAVTINIEWFGGLTTPLKLQCRGLPAGVSVEAPVEAKPAAKNAKLTLVAAPDFAARSFPFEIWGTAETPDGPIEVQAVASLSGDLVCWAPDSAYTRRLRGVTTLKAPAKVELIDKNRQRAVHRGTTYPAPFVVRRDEGYQGEVLLQMAARQSRHRQGIDAPILSVPGNVSDVLFPCFLPEWLETDRTTRLVVMGVAIVEDHGGTQRRVLIPADARVTMILEGALLKIRHELVEHQFAIGKPLEIPFKVARAAKLQEEVVVQLVVPDVLQNVVESSPVTLPPGVDHGVLFVQTTATTATTATTSAAESLGRWRWQLRAEAKESGKWLVVSLDDIEIELVP